MITMIDSIVNNKKINIKWEYFNYNGTRIKDDFPNFFAASTVCK